MVGCKVINDDNDETIGELTDVMITGANDVYVVNTTDNKEVLIPVTKECVIDVNVDEKEVRVHLLPGLLDIYLGNDK